jgi:signal transduction histidine kinase
MPNGLLLLNLVYLALFYTNFKKQTPYGIGGTGLGLYLCRELVERLGGRIWFTSPEGEGSTFFVALPLYKESA